MGALKKEDTKYTYEDYVKVPEENGVRLELVDGELHAMASPSIRHQLILTTLMVRFGTFLDGKRTCKVVSDIDTRLSYAKGDDTAVRPDLVVICDSSKIDTNSIKGAPDLVVEILSPSTARHDVRVKLIKYCEAGVREIWIVDPIRDIVYTYTLNNVSEYDWKIYGAGDEIPVSILKGLAISGSDIFKDEFTEEEEER